jgi:hypothetical protein
MCRLAAFLKKREPPSSYSICKAFLGTKDQLASRRGLTFSLVYMPMGSRLVFAYLSL